MNDMITHTGKLISFDTPSSNSYDIIDIAHSLSMQCRFNGHAPFFFDTARHSYNVSKCIEYDKSSTTLDAFHGLLHDASESYLKDMTTPLKSKLPSCLTIEKEFELALSNEFKIPSSKTPIIEKYDKLMFNHEFNTFFNSQLITTDFIKRNIQIVPTTPIESKLKFMEQYLKLKIKLDEEDNNNL